MDCFENSRAAFVPVALQALGIQTDPLSLQSSAPSALLQQLLVKMMAPGRS